MLQLAAELQPLLPHLEALHAAYARQAASCPVLPADSLARSPEIVPAVLAALTHLSTEPEVCPPLEPALEKVRLEGAADGALRLWLQALASTLLTEGLPGDQGSVLYQWCARLLEVLRELLVARGPVAAATLGANGGLDQALDDLWLVAEVGRSFSSSLDLHQVLLQIVCRGADVVTGTTCAVLVANSEGHALKGVVTHPQFVRTAAELSLPADEDSLCAQAMRQGRLLVHADLRRAPLGPFGPEPCGEAWAAMIVPLRLQSSVYGVLVFVDPAGPRQFTERDVSLAEAIGELAAVAVANAQTYTEVHALNEHLANVLRIIPESVTVVDAQGRLTAINHYGERMLGCRQEEVLGRPIADFYPPGEQEVLQHIRAETEAGREVRAVETRVLGREGEQIPIVISVAPLRNAEGQVTGSVGVATDLRERRRMEQVLVESEKLRVLGQLAGGVAHDFNNVLAAILGRAELLELLTENPEIISGLESIQRVAQEGAATVQRIQQYAGVQGDEFFPVDINAVARDALLFTEGRWKGQPEALGIRLEARCEGRVREKVPGSPKALRDALASLILNAVDAMPDGGEIVIRLSEHEAWAQIEVRDSGVGMSEQLRERALEPFFTTKGVGSAGLGLSVSSGIVRRHGGRLELDSAPGGGTIARIVLPLADPAAWVPPRIEPEAFAQPVRLLVIEDEEEVREVIGEVLRLAGYEVALAANGLQALSLWREGRFDLTITDIAMPRMSGWEVVRAIREIEPDARIILLTGWGAEIVASPDHEGQADAVLTKPIRAQELTNIVREILNPK